MKKTFAILMALMVLCFTQCKPNQEENSGKIKVSCSMPMGKNNRSDFCELMTEGNVRWSDGRECVYLAIPGEIPQIVELESWADGNPLNLEFEGEAEVNLFVSGGEYDIWYFGHSHQMDSAYYNLYESEDGGSVLTGSISKQTGRLEDLGYCHIATTTVKAEIENDEVKLTPKSTLANKIAIALLDLQNVDELYGDAIIGTEYTLAYDVEEGKYELNVTNDPEATIEVESANDSISYVVLLPNNNKEVMIKHNKEDKTYAYTFHNGIKGNKIYYRTATNDIVALKWEEIEGDEPVTPDPDPTPVLEAPTNLVAKATGQTTISLTWDAVQNATSYKVYSNDAVVESGITVTSYTVEGLTAGTQYCYKVTAVNEAGESEASTEACATTLAVPTATNLVATATGQTTISLTWDAVQNAISYKVYSNDTVVESGITATTYTVENLTAGTNYCYYVTAVTEDGESAPSSEACATTKVPSNPDGVFTVNGVTFTMIKVEGNGSDISDFYIGETEVTQALWEAVMGSNPSGSKGTQRPVEKVSWDDCQTFIDKLNQLTFENFTLPTEDQWKYAAKGGNKSQGYTYSGSNTVGDVAWYVKNSSNKTHEVKTKSPNELGIYDMSGNVAEWTSSHHGYMYRFYGGAFPHPASNCTVENWSYNDSDTKANDIGFRLCVSTNTNPGEPEEPTAPTNLVATATGQTTISLTWDAVPNATSYNVYSNGNVVVSGFAQTTYIVKNLTPGTQYCYEVKAVNEAGESEASESACATTESEPVTPTVPAAPTNLVATATGQTKISLTWDPVQNATSYRVYNNENVIASDLTATSYTVEGLTAGTQYCYKVTAVNEAGESEASTEACATTEFPPIVVETITVNGVSFNMIQVEGGTFTMGSVYDPTDGITDYEDEAPAHSVTLTTYSIGETEVTQELWKAVMGSDSPASWGESTGNDVYYPQRPAEFMSWGDCQTFISKLNELTGKNFRLPTEAEWEYAARGGNRSKGYMYSGSNDVGEVAWYYGNYVAVDGKTNTHDVKTKKANELGIYDMSGNVLEWCNDWYGNKYYYNSPNENPQGPDQPETSTMHRVCRGGGWGHEAEYCRVAKRFSLEQEKYGSNYGFRLCL